MTNQLPIFKTKRLVLKEITEKDIYSYQKYFVDYDLIKFLSSAVPWPYPENGIEDFITNVIIPHQGRNKWVWGIFLKSNSEELIGCIDLWREGKPENRGFWLGKKFWNRGIMTEAVVPIIDYAFKELKFKKLIFANAVGNIASRKIKEKTGCKLIEIQKGSFVSAEFTHQEIWELTKENWLLNLH
ncbi:MAG: GNAT family N-acetyltransferase [Vicingaceae bacterium]|nr:GNAT family N-acetyltransferase [Vicingaceae bacterium]